MAVARIACARTGAFWVPPAIEMWAPTRSSGVELRGPASQRTTASGAMQRGALIALFQGVVVVPPASAFVLERLVAADDAESIGVGVVAESPADGAALGDAHR